MTFTPARTTLMGTAVLMACACGAGHSSAKLLAMSGIAVTSKLTHSLLLGTGGLLILLGLARIQRRATLAAALSLGTLAAAAALTPPMMMSAARLPWHGAQIAGGALYLIFGALLVYAFWIAFPTPAMPRAGAKALAMTGTAAATGCSCCMITGAIAGLAVTAGGSPDAFLRYGSVYLTGIALAATGFAMWRGFRPLPWLIAGAVVTRHGGDALRLLGDWMIGDVNLRFVPGYLMYLIGAGLVLKAWAIAYEPAAEREAISAGTAEPAY